MRTKTTQKIQKKESFDIIFPHRYPYAPHCIPKRTRRVKSARRIPKSFIQTLPHLQSAQPVPLLLRKAPGPRPHNPASIPRQLLHAPSPTAWSAGGVPLLLYRCNLRRSYHLRSRSLPCGPEQNNSSGTSGILIPLR